MKTQNTEEHAEFENQNRGDPIPTTIDRRRKRPQLLTVIVLLSLVFSAYSVYRTNAAFNGNFPGSQQFSVVATYSFGPAPGAQILSAGSTGSFVLTVYYAGSAPTSLKLFFNATDPNDYSSLGLVGQGYITGPLKVTVQGTDIMPINNPAGVPVTVYAPVNVVHGQNTFTGTISVDPNDTNLGSFVLQWLATA